ncbi:MAG: UbiA-like polyprenyltransferase [Pirellulaceae bacterium]
MKQLRQILEMIRFSHTLFALPFALMSAVMCWLVPAATESDLSSTESVAFRLSHLTGIILCMVFARSAAMAFNRIADRRIDAENPRTSKRHIPAGELSVKSVTSFTVFNCVAFIASTLLFLPNKLPIILSVPVLLFLLMYSYTKRFTSLAHVYLGVSLMLAPISTWIALRGHVLMYHPADILPAVLVGIIVMTWVAGFDIIYACQDFDFDKEAKLRSIPSRFGIKGALRIAAFSHVLMVGALIALPFSHHWMGPDLQLGPIYHTAAVAVALLLFYEHWLVKPDDLTRVNIAFFQINIVISVGLFLIVTVDLLL